MNSQADENLGKRKTGNTSNGGVKTFLIVLGTAITCSCLIITVIIAIANSKAEKETRRSPSGIKQQKNQSSLDFHTTKVYRRNPNSNVGITKKFLSRKNSKERNEMLKTIANYLSNAMNKNVKKCADFWMHACGGILKKDPLAGGLQGLTIKNRETFRKLLKGHLMKNVGPGAEQAKTLFRSCMNMSKSEKIQFRKINFFEETIQELINVIGKWPPPDLRHHNQGSKELLTKIVQFFTVDRPIQIQAEKLSSQWGLFTMRFQELKSQQDSKTDRLPTIIMDEVQLTQRAFTQLGPHRLLVKFLRAINKILNKKGDNQSSRQLYNTITGVGLTLTKLKNKLLLTTRELRLCNLQKLNKLVPEISWGSVLKTNIEQTSKSVVANEKYFVTVVRPILKKYTTKQLTYYLLISWFMTWIIFPQMKINESSCSDLVRKIAPTAAGALWYDYETNVLGVDHIRRRYELENMVRELKEGTLLEINQNEWLSHETAYNLREKLKEMRFKLIYPKIITNLSNRKAFFFDFDISVHNMPNKADYLLNTIHKAVQFHHRKITSYVGSQKASTAWLSNHSPSETNALYYQLENTVYICAGILNSPVFYNKAPDYINYGAIGFVIAHEIMHGINMITETRWKPGEAYSHSSKIQINSRRSCIAEVYDSWVVDGIRANGQKTLNENLADLSGLSIALNVLKRKTTKARVFDERVDSMPEPFQNSTEVQLFFLTFSQLWCVRYTKNSITDWAKTRVHSMPELRVYGSLINLRTFAEAMNCSENDWYNNSALRKCDFYAT